LFWHSAICNADTLGVTGKVQSPSYHVSMVYDGNYSDIPCVGTT